MSADPQGYKGFTLRETLGLLTLAAVLDWLAYLALTGHPRMAGAIILAAALLYFVCHALASWSAREVKQHVDRALGDRFDVFPDDDLPPDVAHVHDLAAQLLANDQAWARATWFPGGQR